MVLETWDRYDPDKAASEASVDVTYWSEQPWPGMYLRSQSGIGVIGLHASLAYPGQRDMRRVILAHALSYHLMRCSVSLLPRRCTGEFPASDKTETRTLRLAAAKLCPPSAAAHLLVKQRDDLEACSASLAETEHLPLEFVRWWLRDLAQCGKLRLR